MTARPGKSIILMSYGACREGLPTSSGCAQSIYCDECLACEQAILMFQFSKIYQNKVGWAMKCDVKACKEIYIIGSKVY
jgi:hypothetical protein